MAGNNEGGIPGSETQNQSLAEGPPPLPDVARGGTGDAGLTEAAGISQAAGLSHATGETGNYSMEEDQHEAGESQMTDAGPLGLLFETFGRIGQEEDLEERIRELQNRGSGGARRKEPKKGRKSKLQLNTLHPFSLANRLTSRAWSKCCQSRKLDYDHKEKAARLFLFLIIPWESERDSISCHMLLKPTKDINYALVAYGQQEWVIQQKEDSTLAKIAFLYTL